jgi:hypothetical protein
MREVRVCHPPEEEVAPYMYMCATRVRDVRGPAARGSTRQQQYRRGAAWTTQHTTRVRHSRVRHSCTYTPSVYVYATRV